MTRRLGAEDRRRTIIDAATRLFAEHGYHGVSVGQIVAAVGVNPAVLYRHFVSKEALYQSVLHELACRREDYMEAVLDTGDGFEDVLRTMTRIYVGGIAWQPALLRLELHSLLDNSDASREFFENRWKTFTDFIAFELADRAGKGRGPAVDPRVAGLLYQGMIREVLLAKCLGRDDRLPDLTIEQLVERLVTLFLAAIGLAPAPSAG